MTYPPSLATDLIVCNELHYEQKGLSFPYRLKDTFEHSVQSLANVWNVLKVPPKVASPSSSCDSSDPLLPPPKNALCFFNASDVRFPSPIKYNKLNTTVSSLHIQQVSPITETEDYHNWPQSTHKITTDCHIRCCSSAWWHMIPESWRTGGVNYTHYKNLTQYCSRW